MILSQSGLYTGLKRPFCFSRTEPERLRAVQCYVQLGAIPRGMCLFLDHCRKRGIERFCDAVNGQPKGVGLA
jgi:hypothetical protein